MLTTRTAHSTGLTPPLPATAPSGSVHPSLAGLSCPDCTGGELYLAGDHGRPELACGTCGLFVRLLRRHGDPPPSCEPLPPEVPSYAFDPPPAGSWWVGMIREQDKVWRAVSLSPDHGCCWDSLLTFPAKAIA